MRGQREIRACVMGSDAIARREIGSGIGTQRRAEDTQRIRRGRLAGLVRANHRQCDEGSFSPGARAIGKCVRSLSMPRPFERRIIVPEAGANSNHFRRAEARLWFSPGSTSRGQSNCRGQVRRGAFFPSRLSVAYLFEDCPSSLGPADQFQCPSSARRYPPKGFQPLIPLRILCVSSARLCGQIQSSNHPDALPIGAPHVK
jgi:hypothetical protein